LLKSTTICSRYARRHLAGKRARHTSRFDYLRFCTEYLTLVGSGLASTGFAHGRCSTCHIWPEQEKFAPSHVFWGGVSLAEALASGNRLQPPVNALTSTACDGNEGATTTHSSSIPQRIHPVGTSTLQPSSSSALANSFHSIRLPSLRRQSVRYPLLKDPSSEGPEQAWRSTTTTTTRSRR
jgi:hypothetical protein